MPLADHPTIKRLKENPPPPRPAAVSAQLLKEVARRHGADDAGVVERARPSLADQGPYIDQVFPETLTLLSIVKRMNPAPVRAPARSVSNQEFHAVYDEVNETCRAIVSELNAMGIPACNAVAAFPMEVQLPGRGWLIAHKPVAVEAGMGRIGLHRNVIHPVFGSFILLGTVLVGTAADGYDHPIDYNPCLDCKLCVAACPVGALKPDGRFDFLACYTHNYRDFLGNFTDWVDAVVTSPTMGKYRERFSDGETANLWQSLSFKPGYKAAFCIAVCPAGEDVANPFLEDRPAYVAKVVTPLTEKPEPVYVVKGSDAERTVKTRFPEKRLRYVKRATRIETITAFLGFVPITFQPGRAKDLSARYHWSFTGEEQISVTIEIKDRMIKVLPGHQDVPDVQIFADSRTWLNILNRDYHMLTAIILRKVRVKGSMTLFRAFGRCFPG